MGTVRLLLVAVAFLGAAVPLHAFADDGLWASLRQGGQVVLVRHASTTPGVGDPEGMKLSDCSTQRNLSNEGREHAKRVGDAFRARQVPVAQLISSPWCRCIETATLAFGRKPETSPALGNLFGRGELQAAQVAQLKPLAGRKPQAGNTIMVSHGSTIWALTNVMPVMGEMVVLTPKADGGFVVAGRLVVP